MKKPTRSRGRLLRSHLSNLRRLSLGEKLKASRKLDGAYYVSKDVTKVTRRTPIITVSAWKDAQLGVPHGKAATLRKAGRLGYGARGEERAIPKSVLTRISHKEQRTKEQYERTPTHDTVYINTRGIVAHDYFWKDNLRIMHNYRDDVAPSSLRGMKEAKRSPRH